MMYNIYGNFFINFMVTASFLSMSFLLFEMRNNLGFSKIVQFYEFICENNPLLLNYYDENDNTEEEVLVSNNKEVSIKEEQPFESKYLEKYKHFPNKYIFNDFELKDENQEYEKIKIDYEYKQKILLDEIQDKLLEINKIEKITDYFKKRAFLFKYLYNKDEDEDIVEEDVCDNINQEEIYENMYNEFLEIKNKLLNQQKKAEEDIMTEEQLRLEAHNKIINKKLDKYIDNYVLEYTPLGNVYMRYNNDKKSFEYFSNSTIPYRYLEVVGRKYVMTYWCKPIFIDLEEELKKAEEKYDEDKKKREEEDKRKEQEKKNNPKKVLAQLKNYNKETKEQTMRPMKNRSNNNSVLPPQIKANLPDVNKSSEKQLLKECANRYTWEGRLTNFCPLKKIDKKIVDKNLALSYADFKKLQSEKSK